MFSYEAKIRKLEDVGSQFNAGHNLFKQVVKDKTRVNRDRGRTTGKLSEKSAFEFVKKRRKRKVIVL